MNQRIFDKYTHSYTNLTVLFYLFLPRESQL